MNGIKKKKKDKKTWNLNHVIRFVHPKKCCCVFYHFWVLFTLKSVLQVINSLIEWVPTDVRASIMGGVKLFLHPLYTSKGVNVVSTLMGRCKFKDIYSIFLS